MSDAGAFFYVRRKINNKNKFIVIKIGAILGASRNSSLFHH
jgi:hypothetical protein